MQFTVLILLLISGAFGGFVDGLYMQRQYIMRLPLRIKHRSTFREQMSSDKSINYGLGSLGDILVGATASIAVFTIAEGLFNIKLDDLAQKDNYEVSGFIRVIALGVISGFSGIRILAGMSKQLEDQISRLVEKKISTEMPARQQRYTQATALAEEGRDFVKKYDALMEAVLAGKRSVGTDEIRKYVNDWLQKGRERLDRLTEP